MHGWLMAMLASTPPDPSPSTMSELSRDENPSKPLPARSLGSPPPKTGRSGSSRRGRASKDGRRSGFKPRSARESMGGTREPPPEPEADADQVKFEVEGARWRARVLGRSGGGGSTPLLLLGFSQEATEGDPAAAPERETFVVGSRLSSMMEPELIAALSRSVPAADREEPPPFFAEAGDSRGR